MIVHNSNVYARRGAGHDEGYANNCRACRHASDQRFAAQQAESARQARQAARSWRRFNIAFWTALALAFFVPLVAFALTHGVR